MTKKLVSILLVLLLAMSLFAGSALADSSSYVVFSAKTISFPLEPVSDRDSVYPVNYLRSVSSYTGSAFLAILAFQSSVSSGHLDSYLGLFPAFSSGYIHVITFYDSSGVLLDSFVDETGPLPSSTRFISFSVNVDILTNEQLSRPFPIRPSSLVFSDLVFDSPGSGSGSGYDPSLDHDILDGVDAIARSLLDLETGPYTTTSGVSLNSNGVVTPTTIQRASLKELLSLIGASSTYSGLVLEQMNLNFGNYFEYHEIEDTSSGTVTVVKNLPSYVNALGLELTDGINKLQRDNLMIYKQGENIEDALFTDKTENQPWSVAQWLKDIYTAITSFFSSFWSPAETVLKSAAEDGMQSAADNGNAASGSQVDEVNSAADAFKSFGSTGNIGSGDVMDIFSDGASYDFFSQTTKDNLAYHPPAGSQRMLRSSSAPPQSDQIEEEYVDELDDKLSYWREVLGLP